jgi:hypothetical protein
VRERLRAKGSGRDPTGRRTIGVLYQVDSRIRIFRTRPCHGAAALVAKLEWLEFVAAPWLSANLQQPYGMPTVPRYLACQTLHIHSLLRSRDSLRTCTANVFHCRLHPQVQYVPRYTPFMACDPRATIHSLGARLVESLCSVVPASLATLVGDGIPAPSKFHYQGAPASRKNNS